VQPLVDIVPLAESSTLARYYADRIRQNLGDRSNHRRFLALKSTIFLVDFDSGDAITLRFDHGRLTLHDGTIGVPNVTFGGPLHALLGLDRVSLANLTEVVLRRDVESSSLVDTDDRRSSPPPASNRRPATAIRRERASLREILQLFRAGELRIYGLYRHPRTVARFLRLIRA
jgi:hypothetical protein